MLKGARIGKIFVLRNPKAEIVYQSFNVGLLQTDIPIQNEWVAVETENEYVRVRNISLSKDSPLILQVGLVLDRNFLNWEIIDNRLYLTGIDATLEDATSVTLASIFPDYPDRVFAHWYSGDIRIPQGKLLEYVHTGYASRYERDLFLYISKGVITSTEIKTNGQSNFTTTSEGYSVGSFLSFGSNNKETQE